MNSKIKIAILSLAIFLSAPSVAYYKYYASDGRVTYVYPSFLNAEGKLAGYISFTQDHVQQPTTNQYVRALHENQLIFNYLNSACIKKDDQDYCGFNTFYNLIAYIRVQVGFDEAQNELSNATYYVKSAKKAVAELETALQDPGLSPAQRAILQRNLDAAKVTLREKEAALATAQTTYDTAVAKGRELEKPYRDAYEAQRKFVTQLLTVIRAETETIVVQGENAEIDQLILDGYGGMYAQAEYIQTTPDNCKVLNRPGTSTLATFTIAALSKAALDAVCRDLAYKVVNYQWDAYSIQINPVPTATEVFKFYRYVHKYESVNMFNNQRYWRYEQHFSSGSDKRVGSYSVKPDDFMLDDFKGTGKYIYHKDFELPTFEKIQAPEQLI